MFLENTLEEYICQNPEKVGQWILNCLSEISDIRTIDQIRLVGNQIRIGNDNIPDICFEVTKTISAPDDEDIICKSLIIVELKGQEGTSKDFVQICRYINVATAAFDYDNVYGFLIVPELSHDLSCI